MATERLSQNVRLIKLSSSAKGSGQTDTDVNSHMDTKTNASTKAQKVGTSKYSRGEVGIFLKAWLLSANACT